MGDDAKLVDRRADSFVVASIRLRKLAAEFVDPPLGAVERLEVDGVTRAQVCPVTRFGIHQQLIQIHDPCQLYLRAANVLLRRDEPQAADLRYDVQQHDKADGDAYDDRELPPLESHRCLLPRVVVDCPGWPTGPI